MASKSKKVLLLASGMLAAWAGFVAALLVKQEAILFRGSRALKAPTPDLLGALGAQALTFASHDGHQIEYFAIGDHDAKNRILAFPGNGGDALAYASWLRSQLLKHAPELSFCVFSPHYRGYGSTGGELSGPAMQADAKAMALALKPCAFFGRSLGAGMAAVAASVFPAPTLVISPWDSLAFVARDFSRGLAPLAVLNKFFKHEVRAVEAAALATSSLRCLVFNKDSLISKERSIAFFEAWAGEKVWIDLNGRHEDAIDLSEADAIFLLRAFAAATIDSVVPGLAAQLTQPEKV